VTATPILNREIISSNAHFKIHGVMHVASRRQLSVVDVNLFEASTLPTKVKHAVSALMLPFKAEISYVRVNDAFQPNQRYKRTYRAHKRMSRL